jgi:hypothetical protein
MRDVASQPAQVGISIIPDTDQRVALVLENPNV